MEFNYDYKTRKITRDFKIVRVYSPINGSAKCRLSGLPCYVDSERCRKCIHFGGNLPVTVLRIDGFYIRCDHPEQKDSENIGNVIYAYYEWIEKQAIEAYYD